LFALPFYPKRCITCGLSKSDSVPWHKTWRLGLVLVAGVTAFGVLMDRVAPPERSSPIRSDYSPDYDKPVNSFQTGNATAPPVQPEGVSPSILPDVLDPTNSTQWQVGGMAAIYEPLQRMRANASGPVAIRGAIDNWTWPKLVYSDSQENIYIEADGVEVEPVPTYAAGPRVGDPGWGNLISYLRRGQFGGWFVTEFKDPELTRPLIEALQATHPEGLNQHIHPELLKYRIQELWFDLNKGTMTGSALSVHDTDGDFLAAPKFNGTYVVQLGPESRWREVARNVQALLEQAKENPKVADGLKEFLGPPLSGTSSTKLTNTGAQSDVSTQTESTTALDKSAAVSPAASSPSSTTQTDTTPPLQFESGVRLFINLTYISHQPDGSFTFLGKLLQPTTLVGGGSIEQGAKVIGTGTTSTDHSGHLIVTVKGFTVAGSKYTLQESGEQPGTGPGVEFGAGKAKSLEMWFSSASVYDKEN
jgi:hypothetical protein